MITALRRYERWYKYQKAAPWLDGNPEGFEISKGHMFDHTAAFAVLWGANDNARLDNFEKAHQKNAKHAAKRTRQHESTWMNEIEGAVDYIKWDYMDAVKATIHKERQVFKGGFNSTSDHCWYLSLTSCLSSLSHDFPAHVC